MGLRKTSCRYTGFSETNFRQAFFSETGLSGYSAASTSLLSPHSESVEDEYDPYC
jgi:hypothetical protein